MWVTIRVERFWEKNWEKCTDFENQVLFVISQPEVFKSPNSNTYM